MKPVKEWLCELMPGYMHPRDLELASRTPKAKRSAPCPHCERTFETDDGLSRHIERRHSGKGMPMEDAA